MKQLTIEENINENKHRNWIDLKRIRKEENEQGWFQRVSLFKIVHYFRSHEEKWIILKIRIQ